MTAGALQPGAVALITGAGSGIGAAIARDLAGAGLRTILTGRRMEPLQRLAGELGKGAHACPLDVADAASVAGLPGRLPADLREPDILVNNAGHDVGGRAGFDKAAIEDMAGVIETNVIGLMRVTRLFLPAMLARGRGDIVNIGSVAGLRGGAGLAAYNASKFAVRGLGQALREECKGRGVRVSEIQPGTVRTGFAEARWRGDAEKAEAFYAGFPELLTPEDVAACVHLALALPRRAHVAELLVLPSA